MFGVFIVNMILFNRAQAQIPEIDVHVLKHAWHEPSLAIMSLGLG